MQTNKGNQTRANRFSLAADRIRPTNHVLLLICNHAQRKSDTQRSFNLFGQLIFETLGPYEIIFPFNYGSYNNINKSYIATWEQSHWPVPLLFTIELWDPGHVHEPGRHSLKYLYCFRVFFSLINWNCWKHKRYLRVQRLKWIKYLISCKFLCITFVNCYNTFL